MSETRRSAFRGRRRARIPWYTWLALLIPVAAAALFVPTPWNRFEITDLNRYLHVNADTRAFLDAGGYTDVLPDGEVLAHRGVRADYRYAYNARTLEQPQLLIRLALSFDSEDAYRSEMARTADFKNMRAGQSGARTVRLFDADDSLAGIAEKLDRARWLDGSSCACAWAVFDDGARSAVYTIARVSDVDGVFDEDILDDLREICALIPA